MRRAIVIWCVSLGLALTAARAVALPEACGPVSSSERRTASQAVVDWFARTQAADGTFLYRLDVTTGERLAGYSWVRHAGVLLSLEQARAAGLEGAAGTAERGWAALDRQVVRWGDRAGLVDGTSVTGGGTALALAALGERRDATGSSDRDGLIAAFAAQLVAHVRPDGTVAERADVSNGEPDESSIGRFTTGEVLFALARADRQFPGRGYAGGHDDIVEYLALHKARAEGFVPDMADHWGAYALAERVESGHDLSDLERAWAREQMGMTSVMIRFEGQRTNTGFDRWLRGRTSIGSAVGTHGESMQGWARVAAGDPELREQLPGALDRLACNTAVLVDRQISADEAAALPDADVARGTWSWFGVTQMDDQQHALSALLGAERLATADLPLPRLAPTPESWLLAVAAVFLAVEPVRLVRRTRSVGEREWWTGAAVGGALLGGAALAGGAVVDALGASAPTAVVAAAAVLVVSSLVSLAAAALRRDGGPALTGTLGVIPHVVRPAALVTAVALSAAGRTGPTVVALVVAVLVAGAARRFVRPRADSDAVGRWAEQMAAAIAVVVAVALLVDAIYAL